MAILWTFGDSFTIGFNPSVSDMIWREYYSKFKGYIPKDYTQLLSDYLGYELCNLADDGSSNIMMFERFCENVKNIKQDDIIIFGWSELTRFRLVNKNGGWHTMGTWCFDHAEILDDIEYVSPNTVNEILLHRINYIEHMSNEVNNWINLINYTLKNNMVLHWTPFNQPKLDIENLYKFDTIKNETNGLINDNHFSELGHLQLFYHFKNKINNTPIII